MSTSALAALEASLLAAAEHSMRPAACFRTMQTAREAHRSCSEDSAAKEGTLAATLAEATAALAVGVARAPAALAAEAVEAAIVEATEETRSTVTIHKAQRGRHSAFPIRHWCLDTPTQVSKDICNLASCME